MNVDDLLAITDMDILLYTLGEYTSVVRPMCVLPIATDNNHPCMTKSMAAFVGISVRFENDETDHVISFATEDINLYVVGNKITKWIIWYLVFHQLSLDKYNVPYTLQLIDQHINIVKYTEDAIIVIRNDGYHIEQYGDTTSLTTTPTIQHTTY